MRYVTLFLAQAYNSEQKEWWKPMSDQKQQNRSIPVRLRFRSPAESQWEQARRTPPSRLHTASRQQRLTLTGTAGDIQHLQIKELLRLSNLLRQGSDLHEVLSEIASTIVNYTTFRRAIIFVIDDPQQVVLPLAFAGISEESQHLLHNVHDSVEQWIRWMQPEFRISQSYFVTHEPTTVEGPAIAPDVDHVSLRWQPEDRLILPLLNPGVQELLGFITVDDPEDGLVPGEDSIGIIELFANQAASVLYHTRAARDQQVENQVLEDSITLLQEDMERLLHGDFSLPVRSPHLRLQPLVNSINSMINTVNSFLRSVQMVTQAVDEHMRSVQSNSEMLVRDTTQQEHQVHQISNVINDIANRMHHISERAAVLSKTAVEALDVTNEAQGAVDRAVDGMSIVREATLQSSRTMKTLSESGQEINETVLAISDLSIRMHHLALNAAIEAVRAGEQGQGFAVVAQELRTLAAHGNEASRKIGAYTRAMQHETTAVSQSVEQNTQQVIVQTELVTQTGVALEAISEITEQLANLIQGIYSSAENQAQGSHLVVDAVKEILHMTGDITSHMREMQQTMAHLVELTNSLRSRMSVFRIAER
jgi:methyl-accepting chemotaxis protein